MTAPPEPEREKRRQADGGDHDEVVYFVSRSIVYHDDDDCIQLERSDGRITEIRRGEVLDRTRRIPCRQCTIRNENISDINESES